MRNLRRNGGARKGREKIAEKKRPREKKAKEKMAQYLKK